MQDWVTSLPALHRESSIPHISTCPVGGFLQTTGTDTAEFTESMTETIVKTRLFLSGGNRVFVIENEFLALSRVLRQSY